MRRSNPWRRMAMRAAVATLAAVMIAGCGSKGAVDRAAEGKAPVSKAAPPKGAPAAAPLAAEPVDGEWTLVLEGALPAGMSGQAKALDVRVERRDGQWRQAFGESPAWNRACHKVDPAGLKIEGHTLKGTLAVTLNPDPWVPADGKPIECTVAVEARFAHQGVAGTYRGSCGTAAVGGPLSGDVSPVSAALVKSCDVTLDLENVLTSGQEWKRRIRLAWSVRDGKPQPGKVSADLTPSGGRGAPTTLDADTAGLALTPAALAGEFGFRAPGGGQVYRIRLSGIVVGSHVGGAFEGTGGGAALKPGPFTGAIVPLAAGR